MAAKRSSAVSFFEHDASVMSDADNAMATTRRARMRDGP
jgi:hypothetical protein